MFISTGNVLRVNMPPVNEIAIVSGQINANVSGSFSISGNVLNMNTSISGNVLDVNTSISGNVISLVHDTPSFGDPIVLTDTLTVTTSGVILPNQPVSSGVQFSRGAGPSLIVGGISGNIASYTNDTDFRGLFYNGAHRTDIFPVTNLNQLSVAGPNGSKVTYFAITISG